MPGGVHLLIGILLTLFIRFLLRRFSRSVDGKNEEQDDKENMRLGMVVGSVIPDIDIPVVIVVVSFTYIFLGFQSENVVIAEWVHRSVTHSFFILFPVLMAISYRYHYLKETSYTLLGCNFNLPFWFGCILSMIVHSITDLVYLKGVRLLWPFFNDEIFFEVPWLYLFELKKFGPITQKVLLTADHGTEVLFYIFLLWAKDKLPESEVKQSAAVTPRPRPAWSHIFRNYNIVRIWNEMEEEDWTAIFRWVIIVQTTLLWVWLCLGLWVVPLFIGRQMDYIEYFVFLYFPGTVFLCTSLLAPLCFASVLRRWDWNKVFGARRKHTTTKKSM
ncbi:hypothetical protein AKO1_012159 [Acrasis kona]|uniref:Uncharacterized protein n=1 Tax=Acrasis kona TaxID=1008807 RepID=A0AAW2ZDZ9_9EUKA